MFAFENTASTAQIEFPTVRTYLFRQSRVIFWKIAGELLNDRSKEPVCGLDRIGVFSDRFIGTACHSSE